VARRVLLAIPTIFGIITLAFVLIHTAPGDPVLILIGEAGATPEYVAYLRAKFGLDRPIWEQYIIYMKSILQGDLGYSMYFRRPVAALILARVPATMILILASMAVSSGLGLFLGVHASKHPYSLTDNLMSVIAMLGQSMPVYWSGQMLILIFALYLNLLPMAGMSSLRGDITGLAYLVDVLAHLILPAFVLGFVQLAIVFRMTRMGMLEVMREDYIITAKAKGLTERLVVYKHALKNVLTLVLTVVALNLSRIVAGAVLTETTFSWPGLGRLLWQATTHRDYPLLLGMLIFIASAVIIINLIVDIAYAYIDPRIRYR